ncbi:hypothetical protein Trichorick_01466 (plasmid) [Candidatus Trichorickettsia mobilis]|uniref:Uncharacterized protein n=1 Tax=Candidatus Trichorickettsia mobilis TaxID=1346319 RepID=A0ABZ0UWZ6_9RICK|nr:hypothetical protein [Candidatus Trichorickettsia mobilis]WPY01553.1 hypothetical protein Trichorick_01466 [Candidatus Trichorickettsia mobilis]
MKEDEKNVKSKGMGELQFFCTITFLSIVINIFFINRFIISRPVSWHTYFIIFLSLFYQHFVLHDIYRQFFLKVKSTDRLKSFLLVLLFFLTVGDVIIDIKYNSFLLSRFVKRLFFDILIILFTWTILVWFEKRRNKKQLLNI